MATTIPEELLPVIEWWEKDGKKTLVAVAVVAVAILGYYGIKDYRAAQRAAAGDAFLNAESVEQLESAVADYGSSKAGPALKLRLAKAYYDARSYDSALEIYNALVTSGTAPKGFEDIPELGIAQCLEAQEKYDEAIAAYDAFVDAKPESPFAFEAKLGAVRTIAAKGEKDKALERLAAIKDAVKDDESRKALAESTEDLVKRWEKRSLFDLASTIDETAKAAEEATPAVEEPAPAPAAVEAPVAEAPAAVEAPVAEAPAPAPAE